jgi:hypothetical protein
MFELQTIEPVPGLEALGARVQLRELSYGSLRAAMRAVAGSDRASELLLGASLYVDGAPLGLDGLDALPGHLSGAVARAMSRCLELHGMGAAAEPKAANEDQAAVAGANGEAVPRGEA